MLYSVWNYRTQKYDYYQAGSPSASVHAGPPPRPLVQSALGATPEQAAWKLPPGAQKVGEGPMAKGRIATLGDLGMGSWMPVALAGLVAYLIFWRRT